MMAYICALMTRLRFISLFLALIMTIQMLPIAQIGFALGSNLWTEELPHNPGEDISNNDISIKNFLSAAPNHFSLDVFCIVANIYIHTSEQIPTNHSIDVITPPPDVVA